jgi:ubiquinone biosynthesis monooxygenase Coq7
MKRDEALHARTALAHGGVALPWPARQAMRAASRVMTSATYWV